MRKKATLAQREALSLLMEKRKAVDASISAIMREALGGLEGQYEPDRGEFVFRDSPEADPKAFDSRHYIPQRGLDESACKIMDELERKKGGVDGPLQKQEA